MPTVPRFSLSDSADAAPIAHLEKVRHWRPQGNPAVWVDPDHSFGRGRTGARGSERRQPPESPTGEP
jgi:hypothetical protein